MVHEPTSLAHFRQMLVLAAVDGRLLRGRGADHLKCDGKIGGSRRGVTCYVQTDASRGLESEYRGDLRRGRAQGLPGGASTAAPVHLWGAAQGVGLALDSFLVCC